MSSDLLLSDVILDPISTDHPAGVDLRWTPEWDRIKEERRADDDLDAGKWVKKERKAADWRSVRELTISALKNQTKDLQLALWLTEANMRLYGFPGLRDGLRIVRDLMVRYWDQGLFPTMEDGPEDRAGPFEWLNNKLVDAITAVPITVRGDGGQDFSLNDLVEARNVGSEAAWRKPDGEVDDAKKKAYLTSIEAGHISLDQFECAVKATSRAGYEEFFSAFEQAFHNYSELEWVVDEKFGEVAPTLSNCRTAFKEIRTEVEKILEKKRAAEPLRASRPENPIATPDTQSGNAVTMRFPISLSHTSSGAAVGSSWEEAEDLVRSGQVDKGLGQMVQLSTQETSGRNRFQRRLLLAEACLASQRPRLARSVLEELAEQIDKLHLDAWESSETISTVWTHLFNLYKQTGDSSDAEKAQKLYDRLCRLDPWQALGCGEV